MKKTPKPTSNYQNNFGQTFSFSKVPLKGNGDRFSMLLGQKVQHSKIIRVDLNILVVAVSKIFALLVLYPYKFKCYSVV